MNCNLSVIYIKSLNQSSIKSCLKKEMRRQAGSLLSGEEKLSKFYHPVQYVQQLCKITPVTFFRLVTIEDIAINL